jgi:hypothetical protein
MVVAMELHMTLGQLREQMTEAELYLWHGFLTLRQEENTKAMEKSKRGR